MKVVPQIITFLVLIAIGWLVYDSHDPFRKLVDDIAEYSGITGELVRTRDEQLAIKESRKSVAKQPDVKETSTALEGTAPAQTGAVQETSSTAAMAGSEKDKTDTMESKEKIVWPTDDTSSVPESKVIAGQPSSIVPVEAKPVSPVHQADPAGALTKPQQPMEQPSSDFPTVPASSEPKQRQQVTESTVTVQPVVPDEQLPGPVNQPGPAEVLTRPEQQIEQPTPVSPAVPASSEPKQQQKVTEPAATVQPVVPDEQLPGSGAPRQQPVADEVSIEERKNQALSGLAAARSAWHSGNHDKAIGMYLELLREFRNHPDFAGELGNIYFSKGQTELAVQAYSEAFIRLLRNNDLERAEQVLGIVYNIDQEQAEYLNSHFPR